MKAPFGLPPDATSSIFSTAPTIMAEEAFIFVAPAEAVVDGASSMAPEDVEVPISRRDAYLIQFQPDATVEQINEILDRYSLTVQESREKNEFLRLIGTLVVERAVPEATAGETEGLFADPLVEQLRNEEAVRAAVPDLLTASESFPKPPQTSFNGDVSWDWSIVDSCVPQLRHLGADGVRDGNWGLKAARFPAAWRLVENRLRLEVREAKVKTAVLDVGFASNDDLDVTIANPAANRSNNHGTHVAGIIGAGFDNQKGIDGASPWADILAVPHQSIVVFDVEGGLPSQIWTVQSEILATLLSLVVNEPDLRLINLSLGFNWKKYLAIDPADPENARLRDDLRNLGVIAQSLATSAAAKDIVIVSAAGNDSDLNAVTPIDIDARWSSPVNWAALGDVAALERSSNVLVVEAIGRLGQRAEFSNRGGHVSAPGVDILSTVSGGYATDEGTSMAAPLVTALATLLIAYDPEITPAEVVRAIRVSARPIDGAAPLIDALNALVIHDPNALRYLADLSGDGKVDIDDARAFDAQWEQLNGGSLLLSAIPNGNISAVADAAINIDLNGNGVIDGNERAWPLADLNGSGVASDDDCDRVVLDGRATTDIEVLGRAWSDDINPLATLFRAGECIHCMHRADSIPPLAGQLTAPQQ